MSGVNGQYVKTFAEASHALPDGMHMNADYPFMLPPIVELKGGQVTLKGRNETATCKIQRHRDGREFCTLAQVSSFERMFGRKPLAFRFYPFKDRDTAAAGGGA